MKLVSVTTPLSVFFDASMITEARLEAAKVRGKEAHAACAAYARRLPVMVTDVSRPYFDSFRGWFDRYVRRVIATEAEFRDEEVYRIKGHPDIVAELIDQRVAVIDYKTPQAESKCWKSQIAAYQYLVKRNLGIEVDGMALILSDSGNAARGIPYRTQAEDFAAFLAALTSWRYFKC